MVERSVVMKRIILLSAVALVSLAVGFAFADDTDVKSQNGIQKFWEDKVQSH